MKNGEQMWRFLTALFLVAIGVGFYLEISPVRAHALDESRSCGSAFQASAYPAAGVSPSLAVACESRRSTRQDVALSVIGVAFVASAICIVFLDVKEREGQRREVIL